ncbi:MAG TPA: hypothetical protein VMF65_13630 [Acidimicrobiales bacterium]|nr:hypothetical protein [Acidimicrobiales bacterium]
MCSSSTATNAAVGVIFDSHLEVIQHLDDETVVVGIAIEHMLLRHEARCYSLVS